MSQRGAAASASAKIDALNSAQDEKSGLVKAELPPLVLPEGINENELSKVIINILLRRALFESDPLSKWVILAALDVLQDKKVKLTASMLNQLVKLSEQSEESSLSETADDQLGQGYLKADTDRA